MHLKFEEPTSVAEAEGFVGTVLWKFFPETRLEYRGQVVEIDTLVENDQGVQEEGLFYRVEYEDGDSEHLLWKELCHCMAKNAKGNSKKRKSAEGPENAPAPAAGGELTPAAEQQGPGNKRRRQSAQQRQQHEAGDSGMEDAVGSDEVPDSAEEEYEAPTSHRSSGKRGVGKQQLPDSSARNNSRQQQRRPRSAVGSPDGSTGGDNDAAAAEHPADDDAAEGEQLMEEEELDDATLERLLRENNNEVVTVRDQGLAGHIKSVQAQNFMCHQNFAIDFGTHVNVISGSNGSGKSAVLQAIQSGLGVKAKETGRGEKMKDIVRTGCHECKTQVTLWNTGGDAYKPHEYGDWLTVERTIKVSARDTATSKFRLLSSTGRVVSQRTDELSAMLDHLNINAANPLAVMTQDTTRSFLCGVVADKKKYELFMKATMLADMQTSLRKAQGFVDEMKVHMKEIKEDHMKRTKRVSDVKEKLQKLEESAGLAQQRIMFERAVCWAAVEDLQRQITQCKQMLEVAKPTQRKGFQSLLEEVDRQLDLLREQEETYAAETEANQATQGNFAAGIQQLGDALKRARLDHRNKNTAYQTLARKLAQLQEELNGIMETTRESNNDRQREFEEQMQQYQQRLAEEQQKMQAAEAECKRQEEQLEQLSQQQQAKDQEVRGLQLRQHAAQNELNNFQTELHQLQAAKGQKQAMFGPQQAALRALVDRNKRGFEKVPIGPLGMHLTLTNQMWAVAAEVVLGKHLDLWIVHSSRDEQTLRRLASNMRTRVNIFVTSFNRPPYNLSGKPGLAGGWQSLRQFVKVEHPEFAHIIDNKLMDLTHYELVVVDEDEGRCTNAMYNNAAGQAVGTAVHVSGKSWRRVRRAVVTHNYFADRPPRLSHSFEDSLRSLQQLIAKRQADFQVLQQQLVAANRDLQQIKRDADAVNRAGRTAKTHKMRFQHAIQALQAQMPVLEPIDEEGEEDMLAERQRTLQEQITTLQISHNTAQNELEQAHTRMEQAQQLIDERRQEMDEALTQMSSRTEDLERITNAQQKYQLNKAKCLAKLQEVDQDLAALQSALQRLTERLQQAMDEALKICDEAAGTQALAEARAAVKQELLGKLQQRIATGDRSTAGVTQQQLNEMLEKAHKEQCYDKACAFFSKRQQAVERKIASVEETAGGSKEELEHQLNLAETDFRRHNKNFQYCRKILEATSEAVTKRWDKYYELFDSVTSTVSQKFMAYMHRRGHAGKVRVESESQELRLLVKINSQTVGAEAAKKIKAVKDLKQLSGGERSFTTVAFILALGEFTESPFRAMDEFDVFMDAINRRIATQTLLEFAREKGHLQFVFLTPQDLQAVEDAKRKLGEGPNGKPLPEGFVKVVQMRPARPN